MVAVLLPSPQLRPMTQADVDAVMAVELAAYRYPWTAGIFADCLRSGCHAWLAEHDGMICGYGVLSFGANEAHLLNLCVADSHRRRGLGRQLLQRLLADARQSGAERVFLEVRNSNSGAIELYHHHGFHLIARRPNYYPADGGRREDALVMAMELLDA